MTMQPADNRTAALLLLTFLGSYLLIGLSMLAPQARLWGINQWHYFPAVVSVLWLAVTAIAVCLVAVISLRSHSLGGHRFLSVRALYWVAAIGLMTSFVLFRNQVHFLGDGYQLLATLPSNQPYLKSRNFGGMMLPYVLMNALGGPSKAHAELAYQIISVTSGVVFLALAYLVAQVLIGPRTQRFFVWLGLCTSGYSLLFFGYVENYATFLLAVLLFCYVGILVDQHKLSRWWLWPAYGLTALFHIFGLVLLPATLYQFLKASPEHSLLKHQKTRMLIWATGALAGVAAFAYLLSTNLFFRFALVSPTTTRYTVASYTLFSGRHILDWLNLVIVLVPCILLGLLALPRFWQQLKADQAGLRFLTFTAITLLGLAFMIEPGLGMPRDWDLFACVGVPLAIVVVYVLAVSFAALTRLVLICCVALNLSILAPRVATMAISDKGVQVAEDYIRLDPHKCVTYSSIVVQYVRDHSGDDRALALRDKLRPLFPDDRLIDTGLIYLDQAHYVEARPYFARAIKANAMNYNAWANLGRTYLETGQYDSAIANLVVAAGINPYSGIIANNLAWAYYYGGRHNAAEQCWLKSRRLDTTSVLPLSGLATLYNTTGNELKYAAYFDSIVQRPDAPPEYLRTMAEYYCGEKRFDAAALALQRAVQNGLDTLSVDSVVNKYPALQQYWSTIPHSS